MMLTLRIRANGVTPDQRSALIQALREAGLRQDQLTIREGTGPGAWAATACALAAVGMLGAWVWTGQWQWGPTAALTLLVATVSLGLSIKDKPQT